MKEIAPGVFFAVLDFPGYEIATSLVDADMPFVLCAGHHTGDYRWQDFDLPVVDPTVTERVMSRVAEFDFVVPTARFLEMATDLGPGLTVAQLAAPPQNHLDLCRIKGPELWRLLDELGWHFWADIPGNDYGQVASPHRSVVEYAVKCVEENR